MKNKIIGLSFVIAPLGFLTWFYTEPSFEPAIGFIISIGVLATNYWPKKVVNYTSQNLKGRKTFNYSSNNGHYIIGKNELKFETEWSKASDDSIHVYNDPSSIKRVALVRGVPSINLITDAKSYDFSSRIITPKEGDIVVFENSFGHYAAVKVIDIKDNSRSDSRDELTIEYVISPDKLTDFS